MNLKFKGIYKLEVKRYLDNKNYNTEIIDEITNRDIVDYSDVYFYIKYSDKKAFTWCDNHSCENCDEIGFEFCSNGCKEFIPREIKLKRLLKP